MRQSRQSKPQRRVETGARAERILDGGSGEEVTVVSKSSVLLLTQSEVFSADCSNQRQVVIAAYRCLIHHHQHQA